jgi:hypothetical protein
MKYLINLSILIVSFSFTPGKEIEKVLANFQKEYAKKNISMDYEIYYLTKQNKKEGVEKGTIQIGESSYYSKRNEEISFYDKKYSLLINDKDNLITVSRSPVLLSGLERPFQFDSMASMIQAYDFSYKENKDTYVITTEDTYYDVIYHFDKTTYHLTKIVYELKEEGENKSFNVEFSKIGTGVSKDKIYTSHRDFIKIKKRKIVGVKSFKNYTIKTL